MSVTLSLSNTALTAFAVNVRSLSSTATVHGFSTSHAGSLYCFASVTFSSGNLACANVSPFLTAYVFPNNASSAIPVPFATVTLWNPSGSGLLSFGSISSPLFMNFATRTCPSATVSAGASSQCQNT